MIKEERRTLDRERDEWRTTAEKNERLVSSGPGIPLESWLT